ncbi:MAG: nucleotide exchange factor GrpE [Cyanobacteriota bacterium]
MAPSPRERAQLMAELRQQQETLLRDLLPVLDALDRAEAHWQQAIAQASPPVAQPVDWWRRLGRRLARWLGRWLGRSGLGRRPTPPPPGGSDTVRQAQEGIRLIRATLLEALDRHGVEPIRCLGQPFDPECMLALGQRLAPAGTPVGVVLEEAVRGYLWRQALLREAQVLVAGP